MEFRFQCSKFDSTRRVFNGWCDGRQSVQSVSVVNANRNDRQWNVNVNRLDNDNVWNADNRFFFRNYRFPRRIFVPRGFYFEETKDLFCRYSFQPKSIFPASTKIVDICMYFLSPIILHSHATVTKNFDRSFLVTDSFIRLIFCDPLLYEALKTRSRVSKRSLSIFTPIVCLWLFEICGKICCQTLYPSFNFSKTGKIAAGGGLHGIFNLK